MVNNTEILSQSSMSLDDWLCRIRDLHHKDIDMGLARISKVADIMGLRKLAAKVVLIAGTNGKGTTSRFIEAYLLSLGHNVGLFNSPALIDYAETVRVNAQPLPHNAHTEAFAAIWHARDDVVLTEFEFSTLAALYMFKQRQLDFVLLEVGLGGRLDSTNVVEPDVSVLTTVAIDHIGFLGDTREAIGYEKAGIFRADKPAIVGELDIPKSVYQQGQTIGARLMCVDEHFHYEHSCYESDTTTNKKSWAWYCGNCTTNHMVLDKLSIPQIPMQNAATGLACLSQLNVPLDSARVNQVLANLSVEGRFETILTNPQVIADVAHNIEAVSYMVKRLQALTMGKPIYFVMGMLKDKDIDGVVALVKPVASQFYVCNLDTPRGADSSQITDCLEKHQAGPYSCYNDVGAGLSAALVDVAKLSKEAVIVVFGSFFTVAAAKGFFKE